MDWFVLALVSAMLVSFHTLLEKKALREGRTLEMVWALSLVCAVLTAPFLGRVNAATLDTPVLITILIASIVGAAGLFFGTKSLKHAAVSETSPFFALAPLVTAIFAFLILGERVSGQGLIGLLLMVVGMFLLEAKNIRLSAGIFTPGRERYLAFTIFSIFLYGVAVVFDRVILSVYSIEPVVYLAILHLLLAFHLTLLLVLMPFSLSELLGSLRATWKVTLLIGMIITIQRIFYLSAIDVAAAAALAIVVKRLSTLFTVVIGGRLFHEDGLARKAIATVIIITGTALLV